MNLASIISLCAAVLQFSMGLVLLGVSSAPGWRLARVFSVISLSAALFSASNALLNANGIGDVLFMAASRMNYLTGALHCATWLVYAYGDASEPLRGLSLRVKLLAAATLGVGVLCLVTGWHAIPGQFFEVSIPWANVRYRAPETTLFGDLAGLLYLVVLGVVFARFVGKARAGVDGAAFQLVGFAVFFLCAADEVLVSNGIIQFFFLADVGFIAVVVPLAVVTLRRFVREAERVSELSDRLAGEVLERTEERDRVQVALVESERHASLGRLAAGVGHEINNPLAYLRLNIELIGEWTAAHERSEEVRESIESALDGADRIRRVVDALRAYARASTGERRPLSVQGFVQSALRVAGHHLRPVARVDTAFEPSPTVLGDEPKLVQVLINLLTNAAQSLSDRPPGEGVIMVRTGAMADGGAVIEVEDNGAGISAADLPRLAEPYFSTRSGHGGAGLGLFLARGIVQQHGGRIEFESEKGKGTKVRVILPPAKEPAGYVSPALVGA